MFVEENTTRRAGRLSNYYVTAYGYTTDTTLLCGYYCIIPETKPLQKRAILVLYMLLYYVW